MHAIREYDAKYMAGAFPIFSKFDQKLVFLKLSRYIIMYVVRVFCKCTYCGLRITVAISINIMFHNK